jgi:hypothetical protein
VSNQVNHGPSFGGFFARLCCRNAVVEGFDHGKLQISLKNKGFWLAQTVNAINSLRLWQNH